MTGRDGSTIVDKQTDCTTSADLAASLTSSNSSTPVVSTVGEAGSTDETDARAPKPKINVIRNKKRGVHILLQKAAYENISGVKTRFCMIGARLPAKLFESAMSGLAVSGVPDDNIVDTSNVGSTRRKRSTSCAPDDVVCNYDSAYATVESITEANNEFNEEDAAVESEDQEVTDGVVESESQEVTDTQGEGVAAIVGILVVLVLLLILVACIICRAMRNNSKQFTIPDSCYIGGNVRAYTQVTIPEEANIHSGNMEKAVVT